MARPWFRDRPIHFVALTALLALTGCVYERPGYGGYDYGGYSGGGYGGDQYYGSDQYYGEGQYYDNGGQAYGYGGGGYYGNGYGNRGYGYRGYGYGQPNGYQRQEHHRRHHGGDYCRYHQCGGDDNDD